MKRFASLILVLAMVLCLFAGCGGKEADALVGTWKADVDMTEMMSGMMSADIAEYVSMDAVVFTMVMQFNDDGTFSVSLDEASVEAALNGIVQSVKDGTLDMLEAQIAEMGLGMTVEEMLALSGMDLDSMMADLEAQMDLPGLVAQAVAEASGNGKYEAKDGKLFLSAGLDYLPDPVCYEVYTLEGDVLTLVENVGDNVSCFDGLYPMVFHKVA